MFRFLLFFAAVAAAPLLASCTTKTCTLLGCVDSVDVPELSLSRSIEALAGGSVRACRDGECGDAIVTYVPATRPDESSRFGCGSGDSTRLSPVQCTRVFRDGAFVDDEVNVSFVGYSSERPPREGELLLIEVRTKDGEVVASRSGVLHYEKHYPNGPDCGGACFGSQLK